MKSSSYFVNPIDPTDTYHYPFFLWGTETESTDYYPELNDGYLYHYTTPKALMLILEKMRLKVSNIAKLNDVSEGSINWLGYDLDTFLEQMETESEEVLARCSLISFAKNYRPKKRWPIEPGTKHARMWAQYAADNHGACLCIRKDAFVKENKNVLRNSFYRFGNVSYGFGKPELTLLDGLVGVDFIKRFWKEIYLHKDVDWKQENEVRLFGIDLPEYLSLDNSIAYICLGPKFGEPTDKDQTDYNKLLIDTLNNPENKCYKRFPNHSFAKMNYSGGFLHEDGHYIPGIERPW